MVGHIRHIEHYRRTLHESHGRTLCSHVAAIEWSECYADIFPFSDVNADHPRGNQN
jgi:hypothetical protein